ncbi:hypothetical protein [Vibrio proteolyticus]|uniref:RiboL-PSP-HEPN domain-containing protein n=1 Tax=Vibrio proteolyticus NBRC 13287 TaxID=1219065 RepID=U2ZP53_VIBPR|nr:hypothetical protein [Vibrio proteolyticus]GAD69551.1 hypothetical protein VPR01S_37_00120 [Vibrio proteolyticus NBRC 13287]
MNKQQSVSRIHVRYKRFQKEQRDIWESFCLIDFYAPKIKDAIKDDVFPQLTFDRIWNDTPKVVKKDDIYGALHSLSIKGNYRRTLLEAVLTFEDYITDVIQGVYLDIPHKLAASGKDDSTSNTQKIIKLILDSEDKSEIVERLVEEKIRGIFYGNPLDVFESDKAKLELGDYFKSNHQDEMKIIKKAIAIRNIVAHNNGKIDRKYIREADKNASLGTKVVIEREFLKDVVYALSLVAAHTARLVVEKIYKETPSGKLGQAIKAFNRKS